MNPNKKHRTPQEENDDVVELENQFILRLPEEPAAILREAIKSGQFIPKDRFTIQLENDMRHGEVRIDDYTMRAKVVDLPTIVESLKTTDKRKFYKVADICQMMICKEEPDSSSADEESTSKNKKKDSVKAEKKYQWPHGITPPTKNVRQRRFRKTQKKKYAESQLVEKEVKRLLREDNDAIYVKWEVLLDENDETEQDNPGTSGNDESPELKSESPPDETASGITSKDLESLDEAALRMLLIEQDIFGGTVTDSEEEEGNDEEEAKVQGGTPDEAELDENS